MYWRTIIEIILVVILLNGVWHEDKLIDFEQTMWDYYKYCKKHDISFKRAITFMFSDREEI